MNFSHDYILKHKNYIDNRVRALACPENRMPGEYLPVKEIIARLIHGKHFPDSILKDESLTALDELRALAERWDLLSWGDLYGYMYLELQKKDEKNLKGQYFTPPYIVDYITREAIESALTPHLSDEDSPLYRIKILDPACGSGQFVISALKRLCALKGVPVRSPEAAEILRSSIYCFDIDDTAVDIARHNLAQVSGANPGDINIIQKDFLVRDELLCDSSGSPLSFDLIIGNPPWGSGFTTEEKRYFKRGYRSAESGVNSFTLFIERAFDFLSKDGILAYLVPESLLNIKAHRSAREMILSGSLIEMIVSWGEMFKKVFAPSVSIMMRECSGPGQMISNIVKVRSGRRESSTETLVPQESFRRGYESIFNIKYSKRAVNIISSINSSDSVYLKERARFILGIVTGENKRHLSEMFTEERPDPIIVGGDISSYRINFSGHHFKYDPDTLQQVAPKELYLSPEKLVYKFIGRNLTFALDRDSYYTLNNVNSFIPYLDSHSPELLLAVLNSRVIQYYYENNFFTVKVLRGNIERLPIKKISASTGDKIVHLVKDVTESDNSNPSARENIEDMIFHAYGLKDREAALISEHLKLA